MSQDSTTRTHTLGMSVVRLALAAALAITGIATMTQHADAIPYGDPYGNVSPTTTVPRADLTVTVRFAAVYNASSDAWEGSQAIVTVKNGGNRSAGAFSVKVDSEQRDELGYYMIRTLTHNVAGLAAGKSISIESLYFRRYCWVDLTATADDGKAVPESNENNNIVHVELTRCAG